MFNAYTFFGLNARRYLCRTFGQPNAILHTKAAIYGSTTVEDTARAATFTTPATMSP